MRNKSFYTCYTHLFNYNHPDQLRQHPTTSDNSSVSIWLLIISINLTTHHQYQSDSKIRSAQIKQNNQIYKQNSEQPAQTLALQKTLDWRQQTQYYLHHMPFISSIYFHTCLHKFFNIAFASHIPPTSLTTYRTHSIPYIFLFTRVTTFTIIYEKLPQTKTFYL